MLSLQDWFVDYEQEKVQTLQPSVRFQVQNHHHYTAQFKRLKFCFLTQKTQTHSSQVFE